MENILFIDHSKRLHESVPLGVLDEISGIRPIKVHPVRGASKFIEKAIEDSFHPERKGGYGGKGQINYDEFLRNLQEMPFIQQTEPAGKLIVVDQDLYARDGSGRTLGFCFGGSTGVSGGLGYAVVSTARLEDNLQATRDVLRHELGHMFGAPNAQRKDIVQHLGAHCANDLCVMQQKDNFQDASAYAHQREVSGAKTYCGSCEKDIRSYVIE